MKLKLHFAIVVLIALSFKGNAQVSKNEDAARQWILSNARDLKIKETDSFKLSFVRKSLSGETLRFQQIVNDVPVYKSEIVVHFNTSNEITYTSNGHDASIQNISTTPSISKEMALNASKESLKITGEYSVDGNDLYVTKVNKETKLVYRVVTNPITGEGSWEVLVDAQTGLVLSTRDIALYDYNNKSKKKSDIEEERKGSRSSALSFVSGTALVYNPDPLSTAQATYTGNYVDNNDATNASLDAARTSVILPEIDLTSGVYKLKSSYVEIKDFESPAKGLFTQATSDFSYNRNQDNFEAVNAFYHLDKSIRYINETLGIVCRPSLNSGVFFYDPSGLNGQDNSHYIPSTERIAFGEGGVDDAEDADVILHEFGHGIHDWITGGSTPGSVAGDSDDGLGEGNGDYWAQSYSRSLNQWPVSVTTTSGYQRIFNWDGPAWGSTRNTNYALNYPSGVTFADNHMDGQIWSTALMKIWDVIGRVKTDKAFIEGLSYTDHTATQQDAAIAFRQAAIDMNYPCADITTITAKFTSKGYTLPSIDLTMAAIANQTVQADASNTYTLPSYATLANPIVANCNATLTQSPVLGTVLAPGVYSITMVATSGTSSVTRTFQLTVTPFLGVNESVKKHFVLYPNPASNLLNVKGDFDTNESITIYNMLGQTVMRKTVTSNEESIDITSLAKGIYNVYFNNAKASYKFIKE